VLDPKAKSDDPEPTNLPLGILEPTKYEQFGVRLEKGDMVLIYTDSLVEARSPQGALLGEEGLRRLLDELSDRPPDRLIPALLDRLNQYTGGAPLGDDVTALLLRETDHVSQRFNVREALKAGWLFSGLLLGRLVGGKAPIPWPELRVENIGGALLPRLNLRWGRSKGDDGPA
jgi:hypothetical protein